MDFGSRLRLADDEIPAAQVAPIDPAAIGQRAILRHRDEDSLIPQMGAVTAIGLQWAGQESDVQTLLPERRQMLGHASLDEFQPHVRMLRCERLDQFLQEARGE